MTPPRLTADIITMAGRIFTMAISWNEGQKPWDEELIVMLFNQAVSEARAEAVAEDRGKRTAQDLYKHSYDKGRADQAVEDAKLLKAQFDAGVEFAAIQHAKLRRETWFMDGYEKGFAECRGRAKEISDLWAKGPFCKEGAELGVCAHKRTASSISERIEALSPCGEVKP